MSTAPAKHVDGPAAASSGFGSKRHKLKFYDRLHHELERVSQRAFYRAGYWIATHRVVTLAVTLLIALACCIGFLNIQSETAGIKLWVPQSSKSKQDLDTMEDNSKSKQDLDAMEDAFGKADADAQLLFVAPKGANVLTLANVAQIWSAYDAVVAVTAGEGESYEDLCARDASGACEVHGILEFWSSDRATYDAEVATESDLLAAVSVTAFPDGSPVSRAVEFGALEVTPPDGSTVASAQAVRLVFSMRGGDGNSDNVSRGWETQSDNVSRGWETQFINTVGPLMSSLQGMEGYWFAERSIDDELARSISGEVYLFAITYVLMAVFAMLTLGKLDRVKGRARLGLICVTCIVISGAGAYGLCAAFGVPFTSLQQVLPFLLIGIGLDDAFIMAGALDLVNPDLPTAERIAEAMGRCGLSVFYTSIINFMVFMLGANSTLPAIEYFCIYAGVAVLFDFLLQVPSFIALLAYDTDRQRARKYDLLCCLKPPAASAEDAAAAAAAASAVAQGTPPPVQLESGSTSRVGRVLKRHFIPNLLTVPGALAAGTLLLGIMAVCIWGVTQVGQGLEILDLVPDSSYAREYVTVARAFYMFPYDNVQPLQLVFDALDVTDVSAQQAMIDLQAESAFRVQTDVVFDALDVTNVGAQQAMMDLQSEAMMDLQTEVHVLANPHATGPLSTWISDFVAWAAASPKYAAAINAQGRFANAAEFMPALAEFLAQPQYVRYTKDVVIDDSGAGGVSVSRVTMYSADTGDVESCVGGVSISRVTMYSADTGDVENSKEALLQVRDIVYASPIADNAFAFSDFYVNTETDLVLVQQVLLDFMYGLLVVFVLSLFFVGHLRYTAMLTAVIAILDMEIVAFLYFWGLTINTVTAIQLVMAAGLLTDLTVHIIHYFTAHGTDRSISKRDRIIDASAEIGPSVLFAGLTTFVGILTMAFAQNAIFRTFFRMLFTIIALGLLSGIVAVPLLLWAMPERRSSSSSSSSAKAAAVAADDDPSDSISKQTELGSVSTTEEQAPQSTPPSGIVAALAADV
ncbi:patched family-domain-containing protein [Tribonema minus]|uniref:Patched family-domain-containing protein n=1 Tax=Tribonema minus TaxID=303371 RepID=A0A835YJJ3_9STRA|nr:patched family-domain-containing protein [Tribonema minus]